MQTFLVDLIVAVAVGAIFLIARSRDWAFLIPRLNNGQRLSGKTEGALAKFFALFWGWADYTPKDWSNAPYKRGYTEEHLPATR